MKILVFYRQNAEYTRKVEEYIRDLTRLHDVREQDMRLLDPDTREGIETASLYDILDFPSVVVTDSEGQFIYGWSGELPLMDELMGYTFGAQ